MREVTPGEPILPRMTARWFNSTLRKERKTGVLPTSFTSHQSIIQAYNNTDNVFNYLDPVAISSKNNNAENVYTNCIVSTQKVDIEEDNWAICLQKFSPGNVGYIVAAGVTLANVVIRESYHNYVTIINGVCVSACYGRAQLLTKTSGGPSLINIGVKPLGHGIAYTEEKIPKRVGNQMGSSLGKFVTSDEDGVLTVTSTDIVLWNMQDLPVNDGFVQWKEVCGKKIVDVSPC